MASRSFAEWADEKAAAEAEAAAKAAQKAAAAEEVAAKRKEAGKGAFEAWIHDKAYREKAVAVRGVGVKRPRNARVTPAKAVPDTGLAAAAVHERPGCPSSARQG